MNNDKLAHFCSTESCNYKNAIILYLKRRCDLGIQTNCWTKTITIMVVNAFFIVLGKVHCIRCFTYMIYLSLCGRVHIFLFIFQRLNSFLCRKLNNITAFGRNIICIVVWLILYLFTLNEDGCM